MKTLKLQIIAAPFIHEASRVFSSMVRMAYNRYLEGLSENEVRHRVKGYFSANSWLLQSAVRYASGIYAANGNRKVVFGGRTNLLRYLRGKISKEEYRAGRDIPVCIYGESRYGNRLVDFDFEHSRVFYKPNRGARFEILFRPVNKKIHLELLRVQELVERRELPVTVRFSARYLYLSFDEAQVHAERYVGLLRNRVMGIDMNPNYIGMSVIEFNRDNTFRVLHKVVFDLSSFTGCGNKSATSTKAKYRATKLKYETLAVAHRISALMNYWKCAMLSIEGLSVKTSDMQKGKALNRLCNNRWERRLFISKLQMLASIHRYELVEVNPAYSSVVGNFMYGGPDTPDMVAASIEIARRAYKKFEKGWFYPKFNVERLDERWKQTLAGVKTWKELARKVKESGCKYRFLLADCIRNAVFSKSYNHRMYGIFQFV